MSKTIEIGGKELQSAVFEVMRRASIDPEFRALAIKDGSAAVKKANPGLDISQGAAVQFHLKSATAPPPLTLNFVLPAESSTELSESELEQVAGGLGISVTLTSIKIA